MERVATSEQVTPGDRLHYRSIRPERRDPRPYTPNHSTDTRLSILAHAYHLYIWPLDFNIHRM